MTDTATSVRTGGGARETVAALAQLGKVRLVEIWLGPLLAWSALTGEGRGTGRAAAVCLLFVLVIFLTMLASHSLDDVTGFRDGSDQRNYAPQRHRSQHKPLVEGRVTQRQALAFAAASVVLAASVVAGVYLLAGPRHWGVLAGGLAVSVLGAQYSYGINFSYRIPGGGELLTGLCLAGSVVVPYLAARGRLEAKPIVEGLLFGSWLVQVLACSNTTDAADDRIVGRRTVAALTSARANLVFLVGLFSASWAMVVAAVLAGVLSPWALAGLLPASALQAYVLRNGLRGVWRNKRNYGFLAVRYAVVGLVIVNILAP
jgi:1,4-dihydroxy-2-naphthoate octaprenyltransferase